ncbi:hypothetical protein [Nonomuraea jabiensis]|uniref:hypothetical protein n=1 Tax=Nonomuraea jabiensis TaxID=882448 RepID=UPI0036BEE196
MPQHQDLDLFVTIGHRQQPHERERVRDGFCIVSSDSDFTRLAAGAVAMVALAR